MFLVEKNVVLVPIFLRSYNSVEKKFVYKDEKYLKLHNILKIRLSLLDTWTKWCLKKVFSVEK